ncbi:MAG: tetratricopeptide repeat protein [Actinobacteria bacterium]|nr:tetratricopeptide repeat protein [Actinomycetota bacterium]
MPRMLHFLLTDIEGSTRTWEREPETMGKALARHDMLLREVVQGHGGRVVKGVGDGIWAVFGRASDASQAAVEAQQRLRSADWETQEPLLVRVVLHRLSGSEVEQRDGDFFGPGANRCARLLEVGHGGQVLASDAFRRAAGDVGAIGFRDLGEHRLRDLLEPERIYQITHPQLPEAFPPLRSLDAFPHNLPFQRTSFVGREMDLAEITALISEERLITITGAGGAGKTRLALAAAAALVPEFDDGVWLADLGALRDGDLVTHEVAASIGVREQPGRSLDDVLADHIRTRRLLLILDNCEHLVGSCAALVDRLLAGSHGLRVLATSRERLQVPGEHVKVVPPLPIAEDTDGDVRDAAVQLFVDRAVSVSPAFDPGPDELRAIRRICHRLDGIPLAIELAAARLPVLSPSELLRRLDDRFQLLTGGARTAVPQHQTLRATLDWSHDLLVEHERTLFRRLAVFSAPVGLRDIEEVVSDDALSEPSVLDHLGGLVAKSLVIPHRTGGETTYGMLETVREYARQRLVDAGEAEALRDAHADRLLTVAASMVPQLDHVPGSRDPVPHDDVRAALLWLLSTRPIDALELATRLSTLWWAQGRLAEGRAHLEAAMEAASDEADPGLLARAHAGIAIIATTQGDLDAAVEHATPVAEAGGRYRSRIVCLWVLGIAAWIRGELDAALALHEEGTSLAEELAYDDGEDFHRSAYARVLRSAGDLDAAAGIYEEILAREDGRGRRNQRAWALDGLARIRYLRGDVDTARVLAEEALDVYEAVGYVEGITSVLDVLGLVAVAEGHLEEARRHLARAAELGHRMGHRGSLAATLEACATLAEAEGDPEHAARLLGCVDALREELGAAAGGTDELVASQLRERLASSLGQRFAGLHRAGHGLALEEALGSAVRAG